MPKPPNIETLLNSGSAEWNKLRKAGKVPADHTGATFAQLFSANADLSGLTLIGTEWEKCDLSKVSFKEADLSNAYFHGGRLQDCDFRGANLDGATFERIKLLRCDFSGARGLEALELEDVDMDRVVGLDGEEAPPPPPPPAVGITSFTREQRQAQTAAAMSQVEVETELPPFRPQDNPGSLLFRGLKRLGHPPVWVLDTPGLRPPLPGRLTPGTGLESLLREAVKMRLENRKPTVDPAGVERAQRALEEGGREAAFAAVYLREMGLEPAASDGAIEALIGELQAEVDNDDLTSQVDPRITAALLELKHRGLDTEYLGEVRKRLAAAQLFTALLEAGFTPENNWDEAVDASEPALDLATLATRGNKDELLEAFQVFAALPEEAQLRRLAYLAEAAAHLEALDRLTQEPPPEE